MTKKRLSDFFGQFTPFIIMFSYSIIPIFYGINWISRNYVWFFISFFEILLVFHFHLSYSSPNFTFQQTLYIITATLRFKSMNYLINVEKKDLPNPLKEFYLLCFGKYCLALISIKAPLGFGVSSSLSSHINLLLCLALDVLLSFEEVLFNYYLLKFNDFSFALIDNHIQSENQSKTK